MPLGAWTPQVWPGGLYLVPTSPYAQLFGTAQPWVGAGGGGASQPFITESVETAKEETGVSLVSPQEKINPWAPSHP